jgi:hypothetical protein
MARRLLALVVALLATLSAGCGGAGPAGDEGAAGDLLRRSAEAVAGAESVRFDVELAATLEGTAHEGPYTVRVSGRAARVDGEHRADVRFEAGAGGLPIPGTARYAGCDTLYLELPLVLGPGWRAVDVGPLRDRVHQAGPRDEREARRLLLRFRPERWLRNVTVTRVGAADRLEADLDVRGAVSDVVRVVTSELARRPGFPPAALEEARREVRRALPAIEDAVRRAHGTLELDADTHLPRAFAAELRVAVPERHREHGQPTAVAVNVRATFADWNEPFDVGAPAGARPLDLGSLLGGLAPSP